MLIRSQSKIFLVKFEKFMKKAVFQMPEDGSVEV